MNKAITIGYRWGFVVFLLASACTQKSSLYREGEIGLRLIPAEKTGITFNNKITETQEKNHLYYSQIYNGAGVAVGDINNDGLADVFFCGNMVNDRLYLNRGSFQFEDISRTAGIGQKKGWSTGVTMADVNADGYLDIYVCRNGDSMNPDDRGNQLYINNKDLTFTESAQKFGLADKGFSTQAVFFDMDNDGDLDMYQVNQPPDPRLFMRYKVPRARAVYHRDKLYRNDGGVYHDISQQASISNSLAHGLGVSASDFNNDGWTDLYVSNDYDEPDFLYYNNGNGTFKNVIDQKLKHISRFSMGVDAGDVNNDGNMDIITLDMAAEDHYRSKTNMGSMNAEEFYQLVDWGKHYQYMFNTLQINSGLGNFYDVGNLAGIAKTDWSWAGLLVDLDNDGRRDIVVTNGIKKDIRNNDFLIDINKKLQQGPMNFLDMSKQAPSVALSNYIFKNEGDFDFKKVSKDWGFDTPGFSTGIAYGDLDNDGDLDVITNNIDAPAFVYQNETGGNYLKIRLEGPEKNPFGYGARAIINYKDEMQIAENFVTRGYLSSVESGLFFGLGEETNIDRLEVLWPGGNCNVFENISANQTLVAKYENTRATKQKDKAVSRLFPEISASAIGISYKHEENEYNDFLVETLLPHKLSENGPFSAVADVNGDGLEDIFIGGASGQSGELFLQKENGKFTMSKSQPWKPDSLSEDLGCLFLDVDGDNDQDLFVASGGNEFGKESELLQDRIYLNDGKGVFKKSTGILPTIYENSQCVKASDIDNDGDLDLFVGIRLLPGKYPYPTSSYLLLNDNGRYVDRTSDIAPDLSNIGLVTDAVFTDIENDGDMDLMIVGEWMDVTLLVNNNGTYTNDSKRWGLENTKGLWWSITAGDLDNDGDEDYVIGNLGKNNKFKPTEAHPFRIYANDFDNNGTNDIVLAKMYKNNFVPLRGRECVSLQMPYVADKYEDYHSYASSKLLDILPEEKIDDAVLHEIRSLESIILINNGGELVLKSLPVTAQVFPIKSSIVGDFNKDGHADILAVGNHYGVEVETVRYDSGLGCLLVGDGANNFKPMSPVESGWHIPLDSRDIQVIKWNAGNLLFITNNNAQPSLFQWRDGI